MAITSQYFAVIDLLDSRKQISTVRVRVKTADAVAWLGAATPALRDATAVGLLLNAIAGLSSAVVNKKYVSLEDESASLAPAQDDNVYNFDKLGSSFSGGIDNYSSSIPARKDTAYTVSTDGVTVILGALGTAEVQEYVTRFNASVLAKNGANATITRITVTR